MLLTPEKEDNESPLLIPLKKKSPSPKKKRKSPDLRARKVRAHTERNLKNVINLFKNEDVSPKKRKNLQKRAVSLGNVFEASAKFEHKEESEESDLDNYEDKKLTLYQACGLNTMNMFGTGPFITIPFVVASTEPAGPQALIGYALAAFACINDSLIWGELGSMWPDSGGSYVYLRELYGRHKFGRLMAFLFCWQIMVSGPMECASGFIATAQYIAYIDGDTSYWHHAGIAVTMSLLTVFALYREIDEVGSITTVLWIATIMAIIFTMVVGYIHFDNEKIETHPDAFKDKSAFVMSLGLAARFAVYDFTGYYDVNFVGKEVRNPKQTIPIACISTCIIVAICFFLVDIAVIGSLEWRADKGGYVRLVDNEDNSANYIMAVFCETFIGREFAIFFTLVVVITIFGSCFSFMIGLAQIPYTAAKDGYFYEFLSHEHPKMKGLSDYSLLFVGGLSCIFCFLDLSVVIEGMLTMQLLVQFIAQSVGLIYYRYFTEGTETSDYSVLFFPIPNIIQTIIFTFVFITTDNYLIAGGEPLLELAVLFLGLGVIGYLLWARKHSFWPYLLSEEEMDLKDFSALNSLNHDEKRTEQFYNSLRGLLYEKDRKILALQQKLKERKKMNISNCNNKQKNNENNTITSQISTISSTTQILSQKTEQSNVEFQSVTKADKKVEDDEQPTFPTFV